MEARGREKLFQRVCEEILIEQNQFLLAAFVMFWSVSRLRLVLLASRGVPCGGGTRAMGLHVFYMCFPLPLFPNFNFQFSIFGFGTSENRKLKIEN